MSYARSPSVPYVKTGELKEQRASVRADGKPDHGGLTKLLAEITPRGKRISHGSEWGKSRSCPSRRRRRRLMAAFEAGEYSKAAAGQAKLAEAREKAERAATGRPGPQTATAQSDLSWYRLFAHDFRGALAASDRAIAAQPDLLAAVMNKAHALMFLGRIVGGAGALRALQGPGREGPRAVGGRGARRFQGIRETRAQKPANRRDSGIAGRETGGRRFPPGAPMKFRASPVSYSRTET